MPPHAGDWRSVSSDIDGHKFVVDGGQRGYMLGRVSLPR
jgi:hypothetical protein